MKAHQTHALRLCLLGGTILLLLLSQGATQGVWGQTSGQDLAFVTDRVQLSTDTPRPGVPAVITLEVVNNGLSPSRPFAVRAVAQRVGTAEQLELTVSNGGVVCSPCGVGLPGRQPDPDNEGQFLPPVPQQVLVLFNTAGITEGVYTLTITLDPNTTLEGLPSGAAEPVAPNHVITVEISVFSRPELHPQALIFSPPSPVDLGTQVRVTAEIVNSGQRNLTQGTVLVEFAYCVQGREDPPCQPDQTTAFQSPTGSLNLQDFRTRATQRVSATLDTARLSAGLYRVQVKVTVLEVDEVDADNNVLTALLTVGTAGPLRGRSIRHLLVGTGLLPTGEQTPIFLSPAADELWALKQRNLKRLLACAGIFIDVCSQELSQSAQQFWQAQGAVDVDRGTVRIDVLSSAFEAFDTNAQFVINRWQLPAEVTALAQSADNPFPVVYVGLADGNLLRLKLISLASQLDQLSAEDLVDRSLIPVRTNARVTALLPLSNGVVIGVTDQDTQRGMVYYLPDLRQNAIPVSTAVMGTVRKIRSTPGFLYVAADDPQGGAPLFFITRIPPSTGIPENISTPTTGLVGLTGQLSDFVVNNRPWLFIATTDGQNGNLFSYRLSPSQNRATASLFPVISGFTDPDPASEQFLTLAQVKRLNLGDTTPTESGDEVLYIGTVDQRLYAVQTQRNFGPLGQLRWWVQLEGEVASMSVDIAAGKFSGLNLVSAAKDGQGVVNLIDGRNRPPNNHQPDETILTNQPVTAPLHSESFEIDPFTGQELLIAIYGSDALYYTVRPK